MRFESLFSWVYGGLLVGSLLSVLTLYMMHLPFVAAGPSSYFVSPAGDDTNRGTSSNAPLRTIQRALEYAQPGETVVLAPGIYRQDVVSQRDGRQDAPITIKGPPTAVVQGGGGTYVFKINHDNIALEGFTVDGLHGSADHASGYRDKLLYAIGTQPYDGISGLRILHMRFENAGEECVRLRYFAQHNEIAHSSFASCGVYDFTFKGGGKNGEAIYIGTARGQIDNGRNPTGDLDQSNNNWIHHNTFDTRGNECVDIKEGSSGNIIEYNHCTGQRDPDSAGLDSQGNNNVFRHNQIYGNVGAGVRLGGDKAADGIDNAVYSNTIHHNRGGGIKIQRRQQAQICDNHIYDNGAADIVGSKWGLNPAASCHS